MPPQTQWEQREGRGQRLSVTFLGSRRSTPKAGQVRGEESSAALRGLGAAEPELQERPFLSSSSLRPTHRLLGPDHFTLRRVTCLFQGCTGSVWAEVSGPWSSNSPQPRADGHGLEPETQGPPRTTDSGRARSSGGRAWALRTFLRASPCGRAPSFGGDRAVSPTLGACRVKAFWS